MRKFLFVSGLQRSGTTALGQLLNAHPDIALGIERYKFLYDRNREDLSANLFDEDRFFSIRPEETNLKAPSHYASLKRKYAAAIFLGDKVPGLFNRFELLDEKLPEPIMIFITRAPEYVAASWQARAENPQDHWPRENDHREAVTRWNAAMKRGLALARDYPDRFIPVSYEALFSGDDSILALLIHQIGAKPSLCLSEAFKQMTTGWAERRQKLPALSAEQLKCIQENADYASAAKLNLLSRNATTA